MIQNFYIMGMIADNRKWIICDLNYDHILTSLGTIADNKKFCLIYSFILKWIPILLMNFQNKIFYTK